MQDILAKDNDGVDAVADSDIDPNEDFPVDFDELTEEEQAIFRQALLEEVDRLHQQIEESKGQAGESQAEDTEAMADPERDQGVRLDAQDAAEVAAASP